MKKIIFTLAFLLLTYSLVEAATLYVSSTGSGTVCSTGTPCAPSRLAVAGVMNAGDTIIWKNGSGGNYSNIGLSLDCNAGINSGTAGNPITFQAETERQVQLTGGNTPHFTVNNCNYYVFQGLFSQGGGATGTARSVWEFNNSRNLIIRRNLLIQNNRNCGGCASLAGSLIWIDGTSDTLAEENEFYHFNYETIHVLSFMFGNNHRNIFRRNYANPRSDGIAAGFNAAAYMSMYGPTDNNIYENNILETATIPASFTPQGITMGGFGGSKNNNKFLGNISINTRMLFKKSPTDPARNLLAQDNVVYAPLSSSTSEALMFIRNQSQANVRNNTIIGAGSSAGNTGVRHDFEGTITVTGDEGATFTNNINMQNATGFQTDGPADVINTNNLFGNTTNYSVIAGSQTVSNTNTSNPTLGGCVVYIPAGSPLKGQGIGKSDIGANVLYQTVNGVLTTQPLWDFTQTGANRGQWLARGATVAGVNDIAGVSLFDVHQRLGFGIGSCPSPYQAATIAISTPTTASTYITQLNTLNVTGVASCDTSIFSVSWSNDRGGLGQVNAPSGLWSVTGITLVQDRVNTLTFTVNCTEGASSSVTLQVRANGANRAILLLAMNENAGTAVKDISGLGNNGTFAGTGNTWTTGDTGFGAAVQFDGNGWINIPSNNSLDVSTYTFEAKIYPTSTATTFRAVFGRTDGTTSNISLFHTTQNYLCTAGYPAGGMGGTWVCGTSALTINTWAHLAVTYDGTIVRLYVNGTQVNTAATNYLSLEVTAPLMIGASFYGEGFIGKIQAFRAYNYARTAAEIISDRDTPLGPVVPPIVRVGDKEIKIGNKELRIGVQ